MTRMPRISALALGASLGLAAACGPATPAPDQTPVASTASTPSASASAVASGSPSACAVAPQAGLLPSDRLVNMETSKTATHDLVTFVFAPATPGPGGPPRGTLEAAHPPFSHAGSGAPVNLIGEHAIAVRFSAMTIASETGTPFYQGLAALITNEGAFREAILYDASEGVIGWYIGYDGPGCVTLARSGNNVTVMIERAGTPTS